jgi:hypothetical protein
MTDGPRIFSTRQLALDFLTSVFNDAGEGCVLDYEEGLLLSVNRSDVTNAAQLVVHEPWTGAFVVLVQKFQYDQWVTKVITDFSGDGNRALASSIDSPFKDPEACGQKQIEFDRQYNEFSNATESMIKDYFVRNGTRIQCEDSTIVFSDDVDAYNYDEYVEEGVREDESAAQEDRMERLIGESEASQYR